MEQYLLCSAQWMECDGKRFFHLINRNVMTLAATSEQLNTLKPPLLMSECSGLSSEALWGERGERELKYF
jgi:hypothetical protein